MTVVVCLALVAVLAVLAFRLGRRHARLRAARRAEAVDAGVDHFGDRLGFLDSIAADHARALEAHYLDMIVDAG